MAAPKADRFWIIPEVRPGRPEMRDRPFPLTPGAKLAREGSRALLRVQSLPAMLFAPVLQRWHDATRARSTRHFAGDCAASDKIAILAMFQPEGLNASTIDTCVHLRSRGHAVIVVSNARLSQKDRHALAQKAWMLIERPNFGYDFGAYREGLRFLWDMGLAPTHVILLNDSTWFPLVEDDDTLALLERQDRDLGGIFLGRHRSDTFLESYLYRVSGRLMDAAAYRKEWLTLPISSNRVLTIRMGERGHSQRLLALGFDLGALHSNEIFADRLGRQSDDFVHAALRLAAYPDADLDLERGKLLAGGRAVDWREGVNQHINRVLARRNFYNTYPLAAVKLLNYPFMKKGTDLPSVLWRRQYLAAVADGLIAPPTPATLSEIMRRTPAK